MARAQRPQSDPSLGQIPFHVPQLHPQPRGSSVGLSGPDGAQPLRRPRPAARAARLRARREGRGGAEGPDEPSDAPGRDPAPDRQPPRPRRPRDEAPRAPARAGARVERRAAGPKAGRNGTTSDQRPGALALDLVNRVLAVVVDERAVLIPVRAAASAGQLLRTDHHVIDVVLMGKLQCACITVKDSLVVLTLLDVVGQAVGPYPPWVADQLA